MCPYISECQRTDFLSTQADIVELPSKTAMSRSLFDSKETIFTKKRTPGIFYYPKILSIFRTITNHKDSMVVSISGIWKTDTYVLRTILVLEGIHKLRWQYFEYFWQPPFVDKFKVT